MRVTLIFVELLEPSCYFVCFVNFVDRFLDRIRTFHEIHKYHEKHETCGIRLLMQSQ